jgi:toxin YhaV
LVASVEAARKRDPQNYRRTPNAKVLAAIAEIALNRIPQDPSNARYRQGDTLGEEYKHWFRDKFGNGRFRIFFRFDQKSKIIIYAWVNDSTTLREYGSKTDAYAVFSKMLNGGNPPDEWSSLVAACDPAEMAAVATEKLTTTFLSDD